MAYSVSTFGMWQWLVLAMFFIPFGVFVILSAGDWDERWFGLLFVVMGAFAGLFGYLTWRAIRRR